MAKDAIKITGKVITAHSMSKYSVKLENGSTIIGVISGKIRVHHIRILPGDIVDMEISPYDLTKGRIIYRH